jgi:hypothetical protein
MVRRVAGELVDERLAQLEPLLIELYGRLRPHVQWSTVGYKVRGDVKRFMRLTGVDDYRTLHLAEVLSSIRRSGKLKYELGDGSMVAGVERLPPLASRLFTAA